MIGTYGFRGLDLAVGDEPEELDEGELIFSVVDFSSEESDFGAGLFGVPKHVEGVKCGTSRAAQDAYDQRAVVVTEFFDSFSAMIDDFEESWHASRSDTGKHSGDHVVEVAWESLSGDTAWNVGVKDFEKVAEILAFGFFPEPVKGFQAWQVVVEVIVEGHGIEAEVGAHLAFFGCAVEVSALGVVEACGSERARGLFGVGRATGQVNVGGVVGADGGSDVRVFVETFVEGQSAVGADRHEHDIDQSLVGDLAHEVAVFFDRPEPGFAGMSFRAFAWGADAKGHISIFGVGQNEDVGVRILIELGQFLVERFSGQCCILHLRWSHVVSGPSFRTGLLWMRSLRQRGRFWCHLKRCLRLVCGRRGRT